MTIAGKARRTAGTARRPGGGTQKKPVAVRFTEKRRRAFLEALAATANVAASCREAEVGETTVRRARRDSPEFRAAWDDALTEGYAALELMMLERAMKGTQRTVFSAGKPVGEVIEYSDAMALKLLTVHRDVVTRRAGEVAASTPADVEAMRGLVADMIAEIRERLEGAAE